MAYQPSYSNQSNQQPGGETRPRGPRSFYGSGKSKWAIYPAFWKKSWGDIPLIGYVYADDEFYAEREARARNYVPLNWDMEIEWVMFSKPREPKPFEQRNHRSSRY